LFWLQAGGPVSAESAAELAKLRLQLVTANRAKDTMHLQVKEAASVSRALRQQVGKVEHQLTLSNTFLADAEARIVELEKENVRLKYQCWGKKKKV
jgi:hypothetical protein